MHKIDFIMHQTGDKEIIFNKITTKTGRTITYNKGTLLSHCYTKLPITTGVHSVKLAHIFNKVWYAHWGMMKYCFTNGIIIAESSFIVKNFRFTREKHWTLTKINIVILYLILRAFGISDKNSDEITFWLDKDCMNIQIRTNTWIFKLGQRSHEYIHIRQQSISQNHDIDTNLLKSNNNFVLRPVVSAYS